MSTVIQQKTPVEAKWTLSKVQEETAQAMARNFLATMTVLGKYGKEAHEEFEKICVANKIDYFKTRNIKSPLDLVKAMAEYEANIFGSKIKISGDDKQAELTYDVCGCWNAMKTVGNLKPEQEEKMGDQFARTIEHLGRHFGFKSEVKFEEPCATVTFTK